MTAPVRRNAPLSPLRAAGAALCLGAPAAHAQCLQQWSGDFGIPPGLSGAVYAMTNWDLDGAGPLPAELIAAGAFGTASGAVVNKIARWDGVRWRPFANGIGTNTAVWIGSMVAWDPDATGPAPAQFVVGGNFATGGVIAGNFIQRWDPSTGAWLPLGTGMNNVVRALTVWDPDGSGAFPPQLIAGGDFTTAGGVTVNRIARWDGAAWQPLGSGANNAVAALTTLDPDGAGPQPPVLVAGGSFTVVGGVNAARIARYDGIAWQPFGTGMNNTVWVFEHWDAGGGPEMIVGGDFTTAGGTSANRIARWDGAAFHALGTGLNSTARGLTTWDPDGAGAQGTRLVVSGSFTTAGGNAIPRIASWNGADWQGFGTGVNGSIVYALSTFDPDNGGPVYPQLAVGGDFSLAAGAIANCAAMWASSPTPVVITSPAPASTCAGGQAIFTVRAAAGAFPTYQWRRNGVNLTDGPTPDGSNILGANSIQLTITAAVPSDAGSYDVVVSNACGDNTSSPAALTFCYPNCDCSSAPPVLNVQDFTCFLQKFAAQEPYANCDESTAPPTLNVQDFTCFLQKFAAACP